MLLSKILLRAALPVGAVAAVAAGALSFSASHGTTGSSHNGSAALSGVRVAAEEPTRGGTASGLASIPGVDVKAIAARGLALRAVATTPPGVTLITPQDADHIALQATNPNDSVMSHNLVRTSDPGAVDDGCLCWAVHVKLAQPVPPSEACLSCSGMNVSTQGWHTVQSMLCLIDAQSGRVIEVMYGGGVS